MNKKGFTLVELLVVIVIIGILSIIVVPSVININSNINERLYAEKTENIVSAAVLYANNHEEIFNGTSEAIVYVQELVDDGLFSADRKNTSETDEVCPKETYLEFRGESRSNQTNGCVIDPRNKTNMNQYYVVLTKEGSGVIGKFVGNNTSEVPTSIAGDSGTLVSHVCNKFRSNPGKAYIPGDTSNTYDCYCNSENTRIVAKKSNGTEVDVYACLFSGTKVDNYLKYGDSQANWRVLGLYQIGDIENPDRNKQTPLLAAKMITSNPI